MPTDNLFSDGETSSGTDYQAQFTEYKKRFEGEQRAHSRTKTDLESRIQQLEEKLTAKDAAFNDLRDRMQSDIKARVDTATQYEKQLAELNGKLADMDKIAANERALRETAEKQVQRYSAKATARNLVTQLDARLLPAFESGFLNLNKEDGTLMNEEEAKAHIENFRTFFGQQVQTQVDNTMAGSKPALSLGSATPKPLTGAKADELQDWLAKNPESQDWDKVHQQYIDLIAKE